jgi:hypothetical protein
LPNCTRVWLGEASTSTVCVTGVVGFQFASTGISSLTS